MAVRGKAKAILLFLKEYEESDNEIPIAKKEQNQSNEENNGRSNQNAAKDPFGEAFSSTKDDPF